MKQFSNLQTAIFNHALTLSTNMIVRATAGSGKTTTLVELAERLLAAHPDKTLFFGAFNKSIQEELSARLPMGTTAKTFHSHGLSAIRKVMPRGAQPDNWKYSNLIQSEILARYGLKRHNGEEYTKWMDPTQALVGFLQGDLVTIGDHEAYEACAIEHELEIEFDRMTGVFQMCDAVLKNGRDLISKGIYTFIDMVWGPWALNLTPDQFDIVMIDEAQDLNPAQRDLVRKTIKPGGRLIAVGDSRQAIYGFAGADVTSLDKIKTLFEAQEFPLSITYRCPKAHVRLAQEIAPEITAADTADEGIVDQISEEGLIEMVQSGDMILSRMNAPLVKVCFQLLAKGIPATIRGRNIGAELAGLVTNLIKGDNLNPMIFHTAIREYRNKQAQEAQAKYADNIDRIEMHMSVVSDKIEVLEAIFESDSFSTVKSFAASIKALFSDEDSLVVCSSIHKAKGLEADRVFIVSPEKLPHPMGLKTPKGREGEQCVEFVALTRAKRELYFVGNYHRFSGPEYFTEQDQTDARIELVTGKTVEQLMSESLNN